MTVYGMPILLAIILMNFVLAIIIDGYTEVKAGFVDDEANIFNDITENGLAWTMVRLDSNI